MELGISKGADSDTVANYVAMPFSHRFSMGSPFCYAIKTTKSPYFWHWMACLYIVLIRVYNAQDIVGLHNLLLWGIHIYMC